MCVIGKSGNFRFFSRQNIEKSLLYGLFAILKFRGPAGRYVFGNFLLVTWKIADFRKWVMSTTAFS